MRNSVIIVLALMVVGAAGFIAGRKTAKKGAEGTITERVDTLVIRDTIVSYKPKYITRRVIDTAYVPVPEYIERNDTIYAVMEREQVMWEDSLARIYASGINPQVDSVMHYRTEKVINHIIPVKVNPKWGIGIQGGVGAGKGGLTPYVGVGVQYNILTW